MALLNIGVENFEMCQWGFPAKSSAWLLEILELWDTFHFASLRFACRKHVRSPTQTIPRCQSTETNHWGWCIIVDSWLDSGSVTTTGFFYWGAVPTTGVSCCGSRACIYIIIYIYICLMMTYLLGGFIMKKKAIFWMMIFTMSLGAETTNSMVIFVSQWFNTQPVLQSLSPHLTKVEKDLTGLVNPSDICATSSWIISPGSLWFNSLVGGFKHEFYFPFHMWDNPSQLIFICFRGVAQPPSKFNSDTSGVFMG